MIPRTSIATRLIVTALFIGLTVGCSQSNTEPSAPTTKLEWSGETVRGRYNISVGPKETAIPIGDFHQWIIEVTDSNQQPVTAARITMTGGMPSHGHGLPTQPQVTEHLGNGRYLIEGVRFNMAGPWVLEFQVNSALGVDQVQFNAELNF